MDPLFNLPPLALALRAALEVELLQEFAEAQRCLRVAACTFAERLQLLPDGRATVPDVALGRLNVACRRLAEVAVGFDVLSIAIPVGSALEGLLVHYALGYGRRLAAGERPSPELLGEYRQLAYAARAFADARSRLPTKEHAN